MTWVGTDSYLAINQILERLENELHIFLDLSDGELRLIKSLHVYYEDAQYFAVCNSTSKQKGYFGYSAINFLYESTEMVRFINHEGMVFDTYVVVEGNHPFIHIKCTGYKKPQKRRFNLFPFSYYQKPQ